MTNVYQLKPLYIGGQSVIAFPSQMLIKNRYEFNENKPLGEGGFGVTFLANDRDRFGELCVVKRLTCAQNDSNFAYKQEMFEQEAKVLHNLGEAIDQIPALRGQIPKLYAYFTEASFFYLVQQWIPGETLAEQIKAGVLNERQVRQLLVDILPVLQMIHQRSIVHRDIKPSNIIIRESDSKPVLIDFGIVKGLPKAPLGARLTGDGSTIVGTIWFSPPEQKNGESIYPYTDIYSLGITAIYALTRESPEYWAIHRTGSLWHRFAPQVSTEFKAILDKAIQLDPFDRYGSAQEMLTAIQSLPPLPDPIPDPVKTTRIDPVPVSRPQLTSGKHSFLRPLTFSIAGMLVAIAAGYFYSNYRVAQVDLNYQKAQADLQKIENLKKQGDHQACVTEAKRFTQSHTMAYFDPATEAKRLETECSTAADLQNYLRSDVPNRLQETNQSNLAKIARTIQPSVQVSTEEIFITYDSSADPAWKTEPFIREFTRFFMAILSGETSAGEFTSKYANFSRLLVSPKGSNTKATLTTEQWNAYLKDLNSAASESEKKDIVKKFLDQIQLSTQ